ncbi:hypothetical protein FYJ85_11160 [Victivallaceae bacterium BBE-744-WT-12]|uniref:Uncharacterized protein n=1 Tax=Victivallis lenta TaxID=2606640 RepID=A0A844G2K1_9BACT|nr:hypothetical protein [Victivallis lenta]MST97596.1 hypothetical protein [Victivallis lenta]
MKCPKCGSEHISQERRIDGDAICMDCHHRGKPEEFRQKTNFEKMTASPEALAEEMVFEAIKGIWRYRIGEKISMQAFRSRWEAERDAVEYLKQEVENEQHS